MIRKFFAALGCAVLGAAVMLLALPLLPGQLLPHGGPRRSPRRRRRPRPQSLRTSRSTGP